MWVHQLLWNGKMVLSAIQKTHLDKGLTMRYICLSNECIQRTHLDYHIEEIVLMLNPSLASKRLKNLAESMENAKAT